MICSTCSRLIPDELLACEVCTRASSGRTIREYQYAPLRKVIARMGKLKVRADKRTRHVQMFGTELSYCGVPLSPWNRKSWIEYDPAVMGGICVKCRASLEEIVAELRRTA